MAGASEAAERRIAFCAGWLHRLIMAVHEAQRSIESHDLPKLRKLVEDMLSGKPGADTQAELWIPVVKRGINAALNETKTQIQSFELACYKYPSPEQRRSLHKVTERVSELEQL